MMLFFFFMTEVDHRTTLQHAQTLSQVNLQKKKSAYSKLPLATIEFEHLTRLDSLLESKKKKSSHLLFLITLPIINMDHFMSTIEEISSGKKTLLLPRTTTCTAGLPSGFEITVKGQCLISPCTVVSVNLRPMRRLASTTVFLGFIATCFSAASPISRLVSVSVNATYDSNGHAVLDEVTLQTFV